MLEKVKREVIQLLTRVEPVTREQMEAMEQRRREERERERQKMQLKHDQVSALQNPDAPGAAAPESAPPSTPFVREGRKVGRNDPCRSEEHTSELQSRGHLVCRLLLAKKKRN